MKRNSNICFIALFAMTILGACSNENDLDSIVIPQDNTATDVQGRFDNTPFQWDYTYSTDKVTDDKLIFIGDLMQAGTEEAVMTRSTTDRRSSGRPSTGRPSGRRPAGGRPIPGGPDQNYRDEDIFISNPIPVYLGAAFPEKEFGNSFKPEILYPRNPVDVIFNFPRPFIGEVIKENGSIGYKKLLTQALDSKEYELFLKGGAKESFEFMCTEYFSYSDIEKAFSANAGLAGIFSTKIKNNTKSVNVKSRLFGQLISKNFTVSIDVPTNGFFKDKTKDTASENPVYVYSLTYGKVAFLSVESEYSFEQVKTAVEAGIKYKIFSAGGSFSKSDMEIISKSRITLFIIADDDPNGHTFYTLDNITNSFNLSYSLYNPGYPVFCQGNYTKDNSAFYLKASSTSGGRVSGDSTSGGSSSRREGGSSSRRSGDSSRSSSGDGRTSSNRR